MLPARIRGPRWVAPEPLNVAPALVGRALAPPLRRAWAMGLDLAVVALLSGVSGFWLAGGLLLVGLQLGSQRSGGARWRLVVGWLIAALLVLLAVQEAKTHWDARGRPVLASAGESAATADAAVPGALKDVPGLSDAQRIVILEAELAEARKPRRFSLRGELDHVLDAIGASFGWGVVYFSLLPAWWNGQTLGKKLFGLQVVELTGKPMTVLRCLRRYGGYAAGMATGGLGFLQLLWDVNRQALQDRSAHTVVLDLRAPARGPDQAL